MEPEQPSAGDHHNWQQALNPRLTLRLLRPLVQPGVISLGLGRSILARMQHTGAHMPVLEKALRYMQSTADAQAARVPIVYAHPLRAVDQAGAAALPGRQPVERPVVQATVAGPAAGAPARAAAPARLIVHALPLRDAGPAAAAPGAGAPLVHGAEPPGAGVPLVHGAEPPGAGVPLVHGAEPPGAGAAPGGRAVGAEAAAAAAAELPPPPRRDDVASPPILAAPAADLPAPERFVLPAGRVRQRDSEARAAAPAPPAAVTGPPVGLAQRLPAQDPSPALEGGLPDITPPSAAGLPRPARPPLPLIQGGAPAEPRSQRQVDRLAPPGRLATTPPAAGGPPTHLGDTSDRPVVVAAPPVSGLPTSIPADGPTPVTTPIQRQIDPAIAPPRPGAGPPTIRAGAGDRLPASDPPRPVVLPVAAGGPLSAAGAFAPGGAPAQRRVNPAAAAGTAAQPAAFSPLPLPLRADGPAEGAAARVGPAITQGGPAVPTLARLPDGEGPIASLPAASPPTSPEAPAATPDTGAAAADVDELVDRALRKLMRQIAIESERRGRSPWS